jgi:hypothetical protein
MQANTCWYTGHDVTGAWPHKQLFVLFFVLYYYRIMGSLEIRAIPQLLIAIANSSTFHTRAVTSFRFTSFTSNDVVRPKQKGCPNWTVWFDTNGLSLHHQGFVAPLFSAISRMTKKFFSHWLWIRELNRIPPSNYISRPFFEASSKNFACRARSLWPQATSHQHRQYHDGNSKCKTHKQPGAHHPATSTYYAQKST